MTISRRSASPGPTGPTIPSRPNGPPDTQKNNTATSPMSWSWRGLFTLHVVVVILAAPDDLGVVARKRVHVHHPPEDPGEEASPGTVTRCLGRNGTERAEHGFPRCRITPPAG